MEVSKSYTEETKKKHKMKLKMKKETEILLKTLNLSSLTARNKNNQQRLRNKVREANKWLRMMNPLKII